MKIIISDFYKDKIKALESVDLKNELDYHLSVHGQLPKNVYISPVFEWDNLPCNKNNMVLTV